MKISLASAKVLKITAVITLIFVSLGIQAQKKVRFGLNFSPNIGWLKTDEANFENDGSVINFSYGLITEFTIANSENYALATGLNVFGQSGAFETTEGQPVDLSFKQKVQYLELPTALKLKSNEIGYFTYFGKFGLSHKINLAGDIEQTNAAGEKTSSNNTSDILFYNASLLIGAGAEYNLSGNTSFLFGVDFHNGFTDLYRNRTGIDKIRTYNLSVTLGVIF